MNKKYDALDWQSFSQKKDIEEIVKNTKDNNDIQITATIEIAMFVASIVAENLFKEKTPEFIWIIILIITIVPIIWLAFKYSIRFYKKTRPGSDIPDLLSMIKLFDNEICYYALMAESYVDKLNDIDKDDIDKSDISNIDQFDYIEACFYINKTIYSLSITSSSVGKMYSIEPKDLYNNRKISYTRLKNIFNILDYCINKVEHYSFMINEIDKNSNYIDLSAKYKKAYVEFKRLLRHHDSSLIP